MVENDSKKEELNSKACIEEHSTEFKMKESIYIRYAETGCRKRKHRIDDAKANKTDCIEFRPGEEKKMNARRMLCSFEGIECMRGINCVCATASTEWMSLLVVFIWTVSLFGFFFLYSCMLCILPVQHSTYKYGDRDNHHICIALAVLLFHLRIVPSLSGVRCSNMRTHTNSKFLLYA